MIDSVHGVVLVSGVFVRRIGGVVAVVLAVAVWGLGAGATGAQTAASDGQTELFVEGLNRGDGPFPKSGSQWLALVVAPEGAALVPVVLDVEEVPDPLSVTATRITTGLDRESLVLVRGPGLRPGAVVSAFAGDRVLYPAQDLSLELTDDDWWWLTAVGCVTRGDHGTLVEGYEVRLAHGRQEQVLFQAEQVSMDGPPALLWLGDLDRDGRADVLYDLGGEVGTHLGLFLSSAADPGELVGPAAELTAPGC